MQRIFSWPPGSRGDAPRLIEKHCAAVCTLETCDGGADCRRKALLYNTSSTKNVELYVPKKEKIRSKNFSRKKSYFSNN